jgi:hypothetical protein
VPRLLVELVQPPDRGARMSDILDDIRGEHLVIRALHGRNKGYQVTISEDLLPAIKAAIQRRHPELDVRSGIPLTSIGGLPLVVDPRMTPNSFRVDWWDL